MGEVQVVNETDADVDGWDLSIRFVTADQQAGGGYTTTNARKVPAGATISLKLPGAKPDFPMVSWMLVLRKAGYVWGPTKPEAPPVENDCGSLVLTVTAGTTCTIREDPENPPMSAGAAATVTSCVLRALERGIAADDVWQWVHGALSPELVRGRSVEKMRLAYDGGNAGGGSLPDWTALYRPPAARPWISTEALRRALAPGGDARIDLYWRALGRFPGGNADMHTVCYSIDCRHQTVSRREHSNWDGSQEREELTPPKLSMTLADRLPLLTDALTAVPVDSECTLLDGNSRDSDEYDTEWSSQELLVFVPRPWSPQTHQWCSAAVRCEIRTVILSNHRAPTTPQMPWDVLVLLFRHLAGGSGDALVRRLHRRCVYGPQWGWGRQKAVAEQIQPSVPQSKALDAANALVGMGRVNTYTDAGDGENPCEAAVDKPPRGEAGGESQSYGYNLPYCQPIYFRSPAQNCPPSRYLP